MYTFLFDKLEKLRRLFANHKWVEVVILISVIVGVSFWMQGGDHFTDPDAFYHLEMSKLIAEEGVVQEFPWLYYTTLRNGYVDHHFLYHVAAIPFISVFGDVVGFKFFNALLVSAFFIFLYIFLRWEKIKWPFLWTVVALSSSPLLFRISLAKATPAALLCLLAIIYMLFKKKKVSLFVLSALYVWLYGGFILALVAVIVYIGAGLIKLPGNKITVFFRNLFSAKNKIKEKALLVLSVLGGLSFGFILNPYFPKNIRFIWIQLVEIGIKNYKNTLNVGGEWFSYQWKDLLQDTSILAVFIVLALVILWRERKKINEKHVFLFMMTVLFFAATLKSKRYVEYYIPFAVLFCAYAFSLTSWKKMKKHMISHIRLKNLYSGIIIIFLLYILIGLPVIMAQEVINTRNDLKRGVPITRFEGVSKYLIQHTNEGEIIFHSDWDDFPPLFYHNSKNYYLVGLDPTFMYRYNPALYTKFADITIGRETRQLYESIYGVFGARYVIVNTTHGSFEQNIVADGHFEKVYIDHDASIYKVKTEYEGFDSPSSL